MNRQSGPTALAALNEAAPEPNLTVGPCTCAGQADPECDCAGCIGRRIECRPADPWGDTAEPAGEAYGGFRRNLPVHQARLPLAIGEQ